MSQGLLNTKIFHLLQATTIVIRQIHSIEVRKNLLAKIYIK